MDNRAFNVLPACMGNNVLHECYSSSKNEKRNWLTGTQELKKFISKPFTTQGAQTMDANVLKENISIWVRTKL